MGMQPVTLEGHWVLLEPLSVDHVPALAALASDEEIWRYLPVSLPTEDDLRGIVEDALRNRAAGTELPFVIVERASGMPIGSTRVMDIRLEHRGVEIGWTWLGRAYWRSPINSECKYLLLRHLFEVVGCVRVALKTDMLNVRSQAAIERLGATREGVLRRHMIVQGGRYRDTVYYSILDDEWPSIKERLEDQLYGGSS